MPPEPPPLPPSLRLPWARGRPQVRPLRAALRPAPLLCPPPHMRGAAAVTCLPAGPALGSRLGPPRPCGGRAAGPLCRSLSALAGAGRTQVVRHRLRAAGRPAARLRRPPGIYGPLRGPGPPSPGPAVPPSRHGKTDGPGRGQILRRCPGPPVLSAVPPRAGSRGPPASITVSAPASRVPGPSVGAGPRRGRPFGPLTQGRPRDYVGLPCGAPPAIQEPARGPRRGGRGSCRGVPRAAKDAACGRRRGTPGPVGRAAGVVAKGGSKLAP